MVEQHTRKNVFLLSVCQALFMTCTSAVMATSALVGDMLAPEFGVPTIGLSFQFGGAMLMTYPASMFMKRVGRRAGFLTGTGIGMLGAALAAWAILQGSIVLFCAGSFLIGCFSASSRYFRFAAAEAASDEWRSKAISLVLAGGVVAAVTGPTLARATVTLFEPALYAGTFAALTVVQLTIVAVLYFIDLPPPSADERGGVARPLFEIVRQPIFIVALLAATIGYVVMSFLMSITPVAMKHYDFGFVDSSMVIQFHILGMYLPAFFTGHLIARFGVLPVMLAGAGLLASCVAVNLSGTAFSNFAASLLLVGVGWNFLFVGGTTLLTEACEPAEKAKTQGFNELVVFSMIAAGSFTSGLVHSHLGWVGVNLFVAPLIALVFAGTLWLYLLRRAAPA